MTAIAVGDPVGGNAFVCLCFSYGFAGPASLPQLFLPANIFADGG